MKDQNASFPQDLPWGSEDPEIRNDACSDEYYGEDVHGAPWEPTLTIDEVWTRWSWISSIWSWK